MPILREAKQRCATSPCQPRALLEVPPHCGNDRHRAQAPAAEAKPLFLQYAALEEAHGLARAAMAVYDRAVRTVPEAERAPVYDLYLARAHELFGLGKARAPRSCCICVRPAACWPVAYGMPVAGMWRMKQSKKATYFNFSGWMNFHRTPLLAHHLPCTL